MTAAVGVILDTKANTQKIFGGGEEDSASKQTSSDANSHNNDITAMDMSADRSFVCSGQVGSAPVAFTWDATTGAMQKRFKLSKGGRGINAVAISNDGKYVALCDLHNDHNVHVYDIGSGALAMKDKGGPDKIFDACFSAQPGSTSFVTVGVKHIKFWDVSTKKVQKGLFKGKGDPTSFSCAAFDNDGVCYTGGCNAMIYIWKGRDLEKTVKAHKAGFICSMKFDNGKLFTGGKDG